MKLKLPWRKPVIPPVAPAATLASTPEGDRLPPLSDGEVRLEVNGVWHTFRPDRRDGIIDSCSRECYKMHEEGLACGCRLKFNPEDNTFQRCPQGKRLDDQLAALYQSLRDLDSSLTSAQKDARLAEIKAVKRLGYAHTCSCGVLSRPSVERPDPNRTESGLRKDVPHGVLRSHPDFPGTLEPEDEGRWVECNPAWPEMTINWKLGELTQDLLKEGRFRHQIEAVWEECSLEVTEERDALSATVILVRPRPKRAETAVTQEPAPGPESTLKMIRTPAL